MGASSYSSYSGKGSSSIDTSSNRRTSTRKTRVKNPMTEMLELLEEVERCRDVVTSKKAELDSAKQDLAKAEQKVSAQIDKLDPETKARFRRMMSRLDEKGKDRDDDEGR